jgi:Holliday junction resolvase
VSRGHDRERRVKARMQEDDYVVVRAAGSLGGIDLVGLKPGRRPLLVEVKSSSAERGPFADFPPAERKALLLAAEMAGADCVLAHWPPHGKLRWYEPSEWPAMRQRAASEEDA